MCVRARARAHVLCVVRVCVRAHVCVRTCVRARVGRREGREKGWGGARGVAGRCRGRGLGVGEGGARGRVRVRVRVRKRGRGRGRGRGEEGARALENGQWAGRAAGETKRQTPGGPAPAHRRERALHRPSPRRANNWSRRATARRFGTGPARPGPARHGPTWRCAGPAASRPHRSRPAETPGGRRSLAGPGRARGRAAPRMALAAVAALPRAKCRGGNVHYVL